MGARPGFDLSAILQNAFHLFKGRLNSVSGPCDGLVLKMHYRWAFFYTLGGFMTVWYGWYIGKVINCVTSFRGDAEARSDYQNICLSYPFIEDELKKKRFILFYRWVHWVFLLLAVIFYLPRKISKSMENRKTKKLFEDLSSLAPRYDQSEKEMVQRATHYMVMNLRTHNEIYYKYLFLNLLCLFIDLFVLHFIDFILHNRFLLLVFNSYPYERDPEYFKDYISQTFPPFASCLLKEEHKILDGRRETIGCHLTNMELFEKLFFIFWFVIYGLLIGTLFYNIYLFVMLIPRYRKYFLRISKPLHASQPIHQIAAKVLQHCRVGDVYILSRLREHLKPSRFYELLLRLSEVKIPHEANAEKLEPQIMSYSNDARKDNNLRNRHDNNPPYNPNNPNNTTLNPKLIKEILNDPTKAHLLKEYPELLKQKGILNTSILIE